MSQNVIGFDRRLRYLLAISGVTREELSRCLGVTVPVVSRWLNGASVPDIYQFRDVARFFEMPYDWFLEDWDSAVNIKELAVLLGLSEDTVENLITLAENENPDVMEAIDDSIYAATSAVMAVRENQQSGSGWEHEADQL